MRQKYRKLSFFTESSERQQRLRTCENKNLVVGPKTISLILLIALPFTVANALFSGQAVLSSQPIRTAGVQTGDWWNMQIELLGSTTSQTNPYYDYMANAESLKITVLNVSGTNVTLQGTLQFKNQTQTNTQVWLDVATGYSSTFTAYGIPPCAVLAADLKEGDPMFTEQIPLNNLYIGKTLMKTYVGTVFEVNPLQFSIFGYGFEAYYARESGIICEAQISAGTYTLHALITESSLNPIVPEFPTNILPTFILVTLILSAIIHANTKNHSRQKINPL